MRKGLIVVIALLIGFGLAIGVPPDAQAQIGFSCDVTVTNIDVIPPEVENLSGVCTKIIGSGENTTTVQARLTPVPPVTHTLEVTSSNPDSGVSITVDPPDKNGNGNGTTPFIRVYDEGTTVTLTAPATAGGNIFSQWLLDGGFFSASLTIPVLMDANHTATAVYVTPPQPPQCAPHDCR
ncbi:MAG: InlB B-repeat-containing protein [Candidatus Methylomirabilales bacterium]